MRGRFKVCLVAASLLALLPADAFAQEGTIAGIVRDAQGGVMPGVLVEVSSPALIEKVRAATTDSNGQYRITALPIGTYSVRFQLEGFATQERGNVELTSGFTAQINQTMTIGQLSDTLVVTAEAPVVDVQNARQAVVFSGEQIQDLPTNRNVNSLLALTPGINSGYQPGTLAGVCSGGVGVFCNPGVTGFNAGGQLGGDNANLAQGRVMVDGQVVNTGASLPIVGMTGGYTADIANAQEINIQLSGALGESETGGASINIIPRTGGNRYAGNFNMTYTRGAWFDQNNGAYADNVSPVFQAVRSDRDISGAFGGPILRDRLWFYAVGRQQYIHKLPVGQGEGDDPQGFWPNLHEGKFGFNYQPDRSQPRVEYENFWRNVNARITWQASQRNKFNIFWDEQDFCQDPCHGVVSVFTSPESWFSPQTYPNRLQQVSWTNPLTNQILLEAGLNVTIQKYRTDEHRQYTNPSSIPRIIETGNTTGGDDVAPRVNQFAGAGFFALTSGSLNSSIPGGGAEVRDSGNYRTRASASYVTGTHHAKIGYDGALYTRDQTNQANDLRLTYNYDWPSADCAATNSCGNTSLQFPENPNNIPGGPGGGRRPVPETVVFNTGEATLSDRVGYVALYAQDQWTLERLTLSGAVRYDHAYSNYLETCVGPDVFVATQYCTPDLDGVSYQDVTPRMGAAYDLFGNGRTSIKFNLGKYLNAATISGTYANANPARRTVNTIERVWTDTDGDRRVGCNLLDETDTRDGCGEFDSGENTVARFGTDPATNPLGVNSSQCGASTEGGAIIIAQEVLDYCNAYGESLLEGWDRRRYEWQFGLGVQHEILPRLSGEVTWNRRNYRNLVLEDTLGRGCDQFLGSIPYEQCLQDTLNYVNPSYDFFTVAAPTDPNLPGGGGYVITGLTSAKPGIANIAEAETFNKELEYAYNGIDTNFVWRGPLGLRVNGGTSTYRTNQDECAALTDWGTQSGGSPLKGREGAPYLDGCLNQNPWLTRLNGTAAYVIPWVDVLVSTVVQSFPGVERTASMEFDRSLVMWNAESAGRATLPCTGQLTGQTGCLGSARNQGDVDVNLLNNNELFGERITLFDVKLAKNIRFAGRRATIGVDVYNVFNSDAIDGYNNNYEPGPENPWGTPTSLVEPRFARLQVQFNW